MLKDKIILGALVGLFADVIKLMANYIMYLLNLTSVVFWQITATRFLPKEDLFKPLAYFIGAVADFITAAFLGIIFIYILHYTGKKYLWLKGIGFGLSVWVNLFGTILGESVMDKLPQTPTSILVTIIAHFIFGLALAYFAQLLLHEEGSKIQ